MGSIDIPKGKYYEILDGAECLANQNKHCAECLLHAEGHEYPQCHKELGRLIIEAETGEIGGLTGMLIREKNDRIKNMEKIIEDQQERIDIMAADMPEWHFFNIRPMTDEEKEYFDRVDDENAEMIENCPEDGEEVILYTPFGMSIDTFHSEIEFVCFDNHPDIEKGWAWMPVPKPPKGDDDNADTSDQARMV